MEKKLEYGCLLKIYTEEEDPQIVNDLSGIKGELRKKGLPKINPKTGIEMSTVYIENIWAFDLKCTDNILDLEKPLNTILDIIKKNNFTKIFSVYKYNLICYAYVEDYNIYFTFSPKIFKLLDELGIEILFDLYSW